MDLAIALRQAAGRRSRPSVTGVNHFPVLTSLEVDGADGFAMLRDAGRRGGRPGVAGPAPGPAGGREVLQARFRPAPPVQADPAGPLGHLPGGRRPAHRRVRLLRPHARIGLGRGLQHRAEPDLRRGKSTRPSTSPTSTPGWRAPRTCRPGSPASCPRPMIQAMLSGEPFEAPVNIPNAGQAVGLPADVVLESICVIDGDGIRGRDRLPCCRLPTTRSCGATSPPRSSPSRRPCAATAPWPREAFALDPLAGPGRPARHGGHGRRAAGRHGRVAAPVRVARAETSGGTRMRIGFIGLGAMGLPMAGHLVTRRPRRHRGLAEPRARSTPPWRSAPADGGSPRGVAEASEVIILCVPNSPEVVEVVDGMLPVLGAGPDGGRLLDHRPRGGTGAARPGRRDRGARISTLRCRAARPGRSKGALTLMVGGDADVLADDRARPRALRRAHRPRGWPGHGPGGQAVQPGDLCRPDDGDRRGHRPGGEVRRRHAQALEVLTHATGDCVAVRTRLPVPGVVPDSPASHGWEPGFMTDLMAKDLDLALAYAAAPRRSACPPRRRPARCSRRPGRRATAARTSRPWPRWCWRWPAPDDRRRAAADPVPHPRGRPPRPRRDDDGELGRVRRRPGAGAARRATGSWPRRSRWPTWPRRAT